MDSKIQYKSSNTLKLPGNVLENSTTKEPLTDNTSLQENPKDIIPDTMQPIPAPNFNAIYKELHSKFPEIINLDKRFCRIC